MTSRAEITDRAAHRARAVLAWRILAGPLQLGRDWLVGFVQLQGFDRAVALAGQAFTALIPLLIVYSAVVSDATGKDFADQLIRIFELEGSAAASVKEVFAPASATESQVTVFGALLLVVSALSFTRGLQRLYQFAFDQPSLGLRAAKYGLIWLALVVALVTLRPVILGSVHGLTLLVLSLAIAAGLWLGTPFVLLARRVSWQRLVPTALLTGVGMTVLEIFSAIFMPRTVSESAEQFGAIGVAFALLSWLVAAGFVLVVAAAGGAVIDARLRARAPA
jgi:membrane protein